MLNMVKHAEKNVFAYNGSDNTLNQKPTLQQHKVKHDIEKPFQCAFCNFSCSGKHNLTVYIRRHTGEKPFVCKFCEYKSVRKSCLKRHVLNKHVQEKPFQCDLCNYKCAAKYYIYPNIEKLILKNHSFFKVTTHNK